MAMPPPMVPAPITATDLTARCGVSDGTSGILDAALSAMLDELKYFGMGFSWGGFESLVIAYKPSQMRAVTEWPKDATFLRLHIGLENPKDLIADLDAGFARFRKALA